VRGLVGADAANEREASGLVIWIENIDQAQQLVGLLRWPSLEPEGVPDAAAIFDMGMIELAGAVADPDHMARGRVPVAGPRRVLACHRLLEAEQQRLVAGVELGRTQLRAAL